jgi:hypothetical protein
MTKAEKRKKKQQKMKRFASTIGVETDSKYRKFKDGQQLVLNVSTTKYFVIRHCAKNLFGYRLSHTGISENAEIKLQDAENCKHDWDIYWTDNGVQPERLYHMLPY